MSMYEFKLVGGTKIIERYYPASEAPELGAAIYEGEKKYIRIISVPPGRPAPLWKPYESFSMPDPGDLCEKSPRGRPIIRSQAHEREVCAYMGRKRD